MNRYILSFILAGILYISLFASYILYFDNNITSKSTKEKTKRVFISIIENKPIKKQIVQIPKKVKKSKKIIKQKRKKLIVKKNIIKKTKKLQTKITKKNCIAKTNKVVQKQIQKTKAVIKTIERKNDNFLLNKAEQEKYYKKIKILINKNKIYPRRAQKRSIESTIRVRFTISNNGKLINIKILSGKSIFYNSVKKAIKASFPIKIKDGVFKNNIIFDLHMVYKL